MGNSDSAQSSKAGSLLAKTKLEDYDNVPDIYKIISPNGEGELIDLARMAHRLKDYSRVDEYIRNEVATHLLNNGKGEMVGILFTLKSFLKN